MKGAHEGFGNWVEGKGGCEGSDRASRRGLGDTRVYIPSVVLFSFFSFLCQGTIT